MVRCMLQGRGVKMLKRSGLPVPVPSGRGRQRRGDCVVVRVEGNVQVAAALPPACSIQSQNRLSAQRSPARKPTTAPTMRRASP